MTLYLGIGYVLLVLINTVLFKASVGVPIKDVLLLGLFLVILVLYNRQFREFARESGGLLMLFGILALIALVLAVVNDVPSGTIAYAFMGDTVQPILILTCTYVISMIVGTRFAVITFLAATALSGVFVLMQFLGLEFAWTARRILGSLQVQLAHTEGLVGEQARPMGLSFSPIAYSYQLICAYVICNFLHRSAMMTSGQYYIALSAIVAVSAANGTRSLLVAIAVHELVQRAANLSVRSLVSIAAAVVLVLGGYYYLESIGSRVVAVGDASAIGRTMLYRFGLRLVSDFPLGIGWGFDPSSMAWLYWDFLAELPRADAAYRLELHNAYLNFYMHFGLFGVLAILAAFYVRPAYFLRIIGVFGAYLVHAFFHNDGFFLQDDFVWFAFGIYLSSQYQYVFRERFQEVRQTRFSTAGGV